MVTSSYKSIILISGLFIGGFLFGHLWRYLGDNDAIINRYLEAHNARFINGNDASLDYFVFYNDMVQLENYIDSDTDLIELKPARMSSLASVTISSSSLPGSLNALREQPFISFVFPGTFPFICH
jgi:hypothetical protein